MDQIADAAVARRFELAADAIREAMDDGSRWPYALDAVSSYVGARFAVLVFQDGASALLQLEHSNEAEKDWVSEYLRHHQRVDAIVRRRLGRVSPGVVLSSRDFISRAQFERSAAFERWLAPHGLADIAGVVVNRTDVGACLLIACFDREVDNLAKQQMVSLVPAFSSTRAAATAAGGDHEMLSALFHSLAAPVVVVDRGLHVRFANRAADSAFLNSGALGLADGTLLIHDKTARAALLEAFASPHSRSAIMLRDGGSQCCVLHILPLATGTWALFLRRLAIDPLSGGEVVANVYGLTARESSVLLAIAEIGGVPATAQALKLSEGTVKSYLKAIFQKTGARRQADLVRLALLMQSPFQTDAEPLALDPENDAAVS